MPSVNIKKSLQYFFSEFWESVTLFGTPSFYITVILLVSYFDPSFNPLEIIIWFLLLEIACFVAKISIPKSRPDKPHRPAFSNLYHVRSFPSIHTARSVFLAFIFYIFYPELIYLFAIIAILVGCSRIYIKEHDLVDVIGGIIVGLFFGVLLKVF